MLSIVLVGGHDRMHSQYKEICMKHGHKVKVYTQMPSRFNKAIGVPDGMVLFTNTVSHKMIHIALKEAKKKNIPVVRNHNSSSVSLESSLKKLDEFICG